MCKVPCAIYRVQSTMCKVRCAKYHVQSTVCKVPYAKYCVLSTVCKVQLTKYRQAEYGCAKYGCAKYCMQNTVGIIPVGKGLADKRPVGKLPCVQTTCWQSRNRQSTVCKVQLANYQWAKIWLARHQKAMYLVCKTKECKTHTVKSLCA